jgi:3-oxoadipate enol-lactonase
MIATWVILLHHIRKKVNTLTTSQSTQIASINNRQIAYVDEGQGPAVVLIHGFCGSSAYWEHIIPVLSPSYRVIAPDLRGHGQSPTHSETSSMELLADDIAALLVHLHIDQAVVFGHSLGGYVTLALIERHPDLVRKFSLIHSTALPDSEEAKEKRSQGIEHIREHGITSFVDGLIPKLFAEAHLKTMAGQVQATIELGYLTSPEGAMHSLEGMRLRPDRNQVLRDHLVPILLVAGSEDQVIPAERMFTVTGAHIQTTIISGVGHMSMLEAPEQLTFVMTSFIKDE